MNKFKKEILKLEYKMEVYDDELRWKDEIISKYQKELDALRNLYQKAVSELHEDHRTCKAFKEVIDEKKEKLKERLRMRYAMQLEIEHTKEEIDEKYKELGEYEQGHNFFKRLLEDQGGKT